MFSAWTWCTASIRLFYVRYLLPQLEQVAVWKDIRFDQAPVDFNVGSITHSGQANRKAAEVNLAVLLCPSDANGPRVEGQSYGAASYSGNVGTGLVDRGNLVQADVFSIFNRKPKFGT